jgi:hypothetical protein
MHQFDTDKAMDELKEFVELWDDDRDSEYLEENLDELIQSLRKLQYGPTPLLEISWETVPGGDRGAWVVETFHGIGRKDVGEFQCIDDAFDHGCEALAAGPKSPEELRIEELRIRAGADQLRARIMEDERRHEGLEGDEQEGDL